MGLGGYLLWTPVAREIRKSVGNNSIKIFPVEQHGHFMKPILSEVFKNNDDFCQNSYEASKDGSLLLPVVLNNPEANYCKQDTPTKAYHRKDKHIIEQFCEIYGITNPELRCYLSADDDSAVSRIIKNNVGDSPFITIEPLSKTNYTPNRVYNFDKWQKVVDVLQEKIKVVQVGCEGSKVLENVIDLTGKTSFNNTAALIGKSRLFMSSESGLVHAATAFDTKTITIITGYQSEKMVAYPQNFNVNISTHLEPCGLKINCDHCKKDRDKHDHEEIVQIAKDYLCL
jgi:ADP-heptose:LPS heptosyltransferase